jgi:hypothetical protein
VLKNAANAFAFALLISRFPLITADVTPRDPKMWAMSACFKSFISIMAKYRTQITADPGRPEIFMRGLFYSLQADPRLRRIGAKFLDKLPSPLRAIGVESGAWSQGKKHQSGNA